MGITKVSSSVEALIGQYADHIPDYWLRIEFYRDEDGIIIEWDGPGVYALVRRPGEDDVVWTKAAPSWKEFVDLGFDPYSLDGRDGIKRAGMMALQFMESPPKNK